MFPRGLYLFISSETDGQTHTMSFARLRSRNGVLRFKGKPRMSVCLLTTILGRDCTRSFYLSTSRYDPRHNTAGASHVGAPRPQQGPEPFTNAKDRERLMSNRGSITLGEPGRQIGLMEIRCHRCERHGRVSLARHGADWVPDLWEALAGDCEYARSTSL